MARPTKITGMDVTPFSGVKIQKVGAIYTRTLEEGGAIYLEKGVQASSLCSKGFEGHTPGFCLADVPKPNHQGTS